MRIKFIKELLSLSYKYKNWKDIGISLLKEQKPNMVILKNGIQIEAPRNNNLLGMVDHIHFRNIYNPASLPININDIVVDIGANIGIFILFAASKTRNTIYAFEASPRNFEFLSRNILSNDFRNIVIKNVAVSDKVGLAKLFLSDTGEGDLLFDHNIKGKLEKFIEVPTSTLQNIIENNNLSQIDFLKLDCEGSEGAIISSTPSSLLKKIRKIAMEFHDNVSQLKHNEIQKLLNDAGFVTKLNWDGKSPFGYLYGWRG